MDVADVERANGVRGDDGLDVHALEDTCAVADSVLGVVDCLNDAGTDDDREGIADTDLDFGPWDRYLLAELWRSLLFIPSDIDA